MFPFSSKFSLTPAGWLIRTKKELVKALPASHWLKFSKSVPREQDGPEHPRPPLFAHADLRKDQPCIRSGPTGRCSAGISVGCVS